MKTNEVKNVTTGKPMKTGALFRAPLGTTLPTDATTALAEDFILMGYLSEDGITNKNSRSSDNTKAWGGDTVLTSESDYEDSFQMTLIESLNPEVLKMRFGNKNVTAAAENITLRVNSSERESGVYVIDILLKNGGVKRIVIPEAKITDTGDIVYNDTDPIGYDMTLTAFPHSGFEGDTHREYIKTAGE